MYIDNNVSALSYESNIGIGFTFNPTLSINISSSDLVISNLTPGSIADSNSINVSVSTNAAYGYTLSAITNNESLVHTNNTNTFSSIAANADLETLTTDNTWGYAYKLPSETTWSNYNGLSNSNSTTLIDNSNAADSNGSVDFKISAKASSNQASGVYTGTITFVAVTKPTPMNLAESYFAHGKSRYKGYYTMQDMNTEICNDTEVIGEGSQTELIDIRDDKVYWATKLADNHCWMTQNLDLDLDSNRTYTHWDTDLGWSTEGGSTIDEDATWKPSSSTIDFDGATTNQVAGWINSNTEPYSANPGDIYFYTSNTEADDIKYNSLQKCITAGHNDCSHYHAGNYYNWSAAVASNNSININNVNDRAAHSICPKSWRLPNDSAANDEYNEFGELLYNGYSIINSISDNFSLIEYTANGFNKIRSSPIYFSRSGRVYNRNSEAFKSIGTYQSNTVYNSSWSYSIEFKNDGVLLSSRFYDRNGGRSVRCLAR